MTYDYIKQGDCLELIREIPEGSVDLFFTDPPYKVRCGNGGTVNKLLKLDKSLEDISQIKDGYDMVFLAEQIKRIQGKNINAYFWTSKTQIPQYFDIYVNRFGCKFDIICWHKQNALPTYHNKYLTDTEYCLYFHSGNAYAHPKDYNSAKTYEVGYINHDDKKKWGHPTIKPVSICQRLIANSTEEGMVVCDHFMGSGTTAIACVKEKRHYVGFELNEEYFKIAKKRIELE